MSQAPTQQSQSVSHTRDRVHISNVSWPDYTRFLRMFEDRPGYRLIYDRGELEIMSPSLRHDKDGRTLGRLIVTLTEELDLPLFPGGGVTIRRRKHQKGLEPDDCFWIATAAQMAGVTQLDLRRDPPPDLAVEVDVTNSSLDRMAIYARLRVPEVWHVSGDVLTFFLLQPSGKFAPALRSLSFPSIAPTDLMPFVVQSRLAGDHNPIIRAFRVWVQQLIAPKP